MPGWFKFLVDGAKAAKSSRIAMHEAGEALARSTAKMADKATKLAAKGDAEGAAKFLEQATNTAKQNKELMATAKLSEAEKWSKIKRYSIVGGAGFLGYKKFVEGEGVMSSAADVLLDTPEKGQGYLSKQWETFVGKHNAEKGLAELGVDTFLGDGSYRYASNEMGEAYHGISDRLSGFFSRPGQQPMPYPAQQGYDPAYYNAVNNPQAQVNQGGFLSRWGAATQGFDLPNYMSQVTGGHMTYTNLAQAIVGTFLTFGPFGKLAKLGGLLLGFNGYRDMFQGQGQGVAVQQNYDQNNGLNRQQLFEAIIEQQREREETIHRNRGLMV